MGSILKTKTWVDNDNVTYTDINGNFDTVYNEFNGNIDNTNIKASAGIAASKLDATVVTTTGSQTLSNKVLTKPTVNGSVQGLTTDVDGSTITFDLSASNIHTVVLGGNRTLALSNDVAGQAFILRLVQDGTGSRTVTWFTTIKWANGIIPTLTTTINKTDVFSFLCTSSSNYDGFVVGQNL